MEVYAFDKYLQERLVELTEILSDSLIILLNRLMVWRPQYKTIIDVRS